MSISSIVKLRACDRCRFVFDMTEYNGNRNCPLCQTNTHSASIVHGERTEEFLKTQEPMQKRLIAIKREEALREFERNVEHATTIKRNIVKEKLNISSLENVLNKDVSVQSLQSLAVMRGLIAGSIKPNPPTFYLPPSENKNRLTAADYGVIGYRPPAKSTWEAFREAWELNKKGKDEKKKE